jgi:hypothetical protein
VTVVINICSVNIKQFRHQFLSNGSLDLIHPAEVAAFVAVVQASNLGMVLDALEGVV